MSLFYTTPDQVLRHPLNRPWGEIHAMSDAAFAQWWAETAHLLVQQYEQCDTPPKNALSEEELLAEFRRLCTIDPSTQIVRDFTDDSIAYLNTIRVFVADQFFKNIYEAKDRLSNRWLSVLDQLREPDEFVNDMMRVLKHDGRYLFASTVPRTTASLEDYLTAHREHSGFLFYKPDNDRKKPFHGKYFAQVGEVRRFIARGLLPKSVGRDLKALKATEKVFLREYRKDERVFPKLFPILKTTLISAPTNFPAVVARSIYSRYALPRKQGAEVTIWDPSMGFGGRLLGALSLLDRPIHYIGTDPNSLNYFADGSSRYSNLELVFKSELMSRRDTFRGTYLKCGSEEVHTLPAFQAYRGKVDLVFTSPPYFSAELYNEEPTQSSRKFGTYQDWREHFLARTMQTGAEWLRKGGYLILNVANSGGHPIEDDVRIIARQLKLKRAATEKMLLALSPGSGRKQGGHPTTWNFTHIRGKDKKYEPIYLLLKEHDTPSIKKFYFSPLHQPKAKSSPHPQVVPISTATTAMLKALSPSSAKGWGTIRTLYRTFDKKCHNPFGKIKRPDEIVSITDGRQVIAAYVVNRRKTKGEECLYRGEKRSVPIVRYEARDLEISKLAAFAQTPAAQNAIITALKRVQRPCAVEVFADDAFLARCLTQAGFVCLGSSINSQSDVYHIYLDASHADSRRCAINPAERTNIKELPIRGLLPLVKRLERRLNKIDRYESHPSAYNKNATWGAIALRGYLPDPRYIESLEEHANYQTALNQKWLKKYPKHRRGLQDTPLMRQFPEVCQILEKICPGSLKDGNAQFKRVRLMRLAPTEGELFRHTDLGDATLGIENGKTIRLHVPIRTNPKVFVTSWDTNDQEHRIHMKLGSLWYLNIRLPHKVINQGDTERVHLVIDCVANERIRELIGGAQTATKQPQHTALPNVDKERLHNALRAMGRKWLHKKTMKWSPENPTHNYCYVVTEWYHRFLAPEGTSTWKVKMPGDPYVHRFNKLPDGTVHDLTSEQFEGIPIPYEKAKEFHLLKTGGPQPSRRAQLLNHLYNEGTESTFQFRKGRHNWRALQETPENLLRDWTDPNPAPVITEHEGFLVADDSVLGVGSKIRFLDYLVKTAPEKEFVFGASNKVGYGAISLSYLCRKYKKKAVFFMAKTSNPTWHQKRVKELGGKIHWVPDGMLVVCQAKARAYAAKAPKSRRLLPIGLEDATVLASIVKVARGLTYKNKPVVPTEIWSVGSSGTLSRGLQAAFPKAAVHVVQTGHSMSKEQIGRAILHKSPYKFDRRCKEHEMPPFPSEPYYDSKLWSFVKKHGKEGALVWNVAGN